MEEFINWSLIISLGQRTCISHWDKYNTRRSILPILIRPKGDDVGKGG